ncbi:MAG: gliding motility-associated C-terminal domain-containing protein [Prevotellaceae bacterium]|jgi:gliding motility-associated-like protein|nr:gliding motility-associated C-terminal domain-containing protein [Prevotellaceae bacterium]
MKINSISCLIVSILLLCSNSVTAQNNTFDIGGGPGELKILVTTNGKYHVQRESFPGSGIWEDQFYQDMGSYASLFAIKIGNDIYRSNNPADFTIGNDVITTSGTRGEYSKKFSGNHYGEPFSVTVKVTYDTSNPDYFLLDATINADNITTGQPISYAYGFDAYVNGCDGGAAWILPDPSGYNGVDVSRNLTSAEVQSLQFVGGINNWGSGSFMGFFPISHSFDRAYSAYYGNSNAGNIVHSTQNNLFKFGPTSAITCSGTGPWDNGIGVAFDNILSGTTTAISTGLTFTNDLEGTLDYTWDNVKNKTTTIGSTVMLNLIYKNLGSNVLSGIDFRTDFPGLSINAACILNSWLGGTSLGTIGQNFYKMSGASVASLGTATVDVPILVTQYGQWVVNAGSVSETAKTLPIGSPATLTAPTAVNISSVSSTSTCNGGTVTVTIKLDGTGTAAQDIVVSIDYTGGTATPSDYISCPPTVTIPAGSNSITFSIVTASTAVDGRVIKYTLAGTDKAWATIGTNKTNQVTILHSLNPTLSSPSTASVCSNAPFSYTATSAAAISYSWTRAAVTGIGNAAGNGTGSVINETLINTTHTPINVTYVFSISSGSCSNTQNVAVTVNPDLPFLDVSDANICSGSTATLTIPKPISAASYTWYLSGMAVHAGTSYTTPALTANTSYTVAVTGTVCTPNPSLKVINVNVTQPPAINVSDQAICEGSSVTLTETAPVAGAIYNWYLGASLVHTGTSYTTPTLTTTTSYTVEMTNVPCPPPPKTVTVTVNPPWTATFTPSVAKVCYNNPAIIQMANVDPTHTYNIYQDAALTQLVTSVSGISASTINIASNLTESTTYYIQATDNGTCKSEAVSVYVEVIKFDIQPDALPSYRMGQTYNVQLVTGADTPAFSISAGSLPSWMLFTNGLMHGSVPQGHDADYNFTVQVTDINGCVEARSYMLRAELFIPEVFSPNGDGVNDYFMKGYKVIIFDRFGIKLFEGDDGWDGTYKGKAMPPDTYFYILYAVDKATGKEKEHTGYIMILKRWKR